MNWWILAAAAVGMVIVGMIVLRAVDMHADVTAWRWLRESDSGQGGVFEPAMVAGLPEPAQRYFNFTIQPGTPLHTVACIDMGGELGLGNRNDPGYRPMRARQILAPPYGLLWKLRMGFISGSDGAMPDHSWTHLRMFGLVPVVRAKGPDHLRSAFGRVVVEGAFWVPASLLPGGHVQWEGLGTDTARATVSSGGRTQAVDITVDEDGAPVKVLIQRWSNENPEKRFREQPFGGELSAFRNFSGYRLPTRVEGGNHFGTKDYFPFFRAEVTDIRFPGQEPS